MTFNGYGNLGGFGGNRTAPSNPGISDELLDKYGEEGLTTIVAPSGKTVVAQAQQGYRSSFVDDLANLFRGKGMTLKPGMHYDFQTGTMMSRDAYEMANVAAQQEFAQPGEVVVPGAGGYQQAVDVGGQVQDVGGVSASDDRGLVAGVSNTTLAVGALAIGALAIGAYALSRKRRR